MQDNFDDTIPTIGASFVQDISHLSISLGNNAGGTCLRMIGNLNYYTEAAVSEVFNIGVGVVVVTAEALAAGVVPDPLSDTTQDWYYYHAWQGNLSQDDQHTQNFDIRSARRLREGYALAWSTQNFTQEVAGKLSVRIRSLWTLE